MIAKRLEALDADPFLSGRRDLLFWRSLLI